MTFLLALSLSWAVARPGHAAFPRRAPTMLGGWSGAQALPPPVPRRTALTFHPLRFALDPLSFALSLGGHSMLGHVPRVLSGERRPGGAGQAEDVYQAASRSPYSPPHRPASSVLRTGLEPLAPFERQAPPERQARKSLEVLIRPVMPPLRHVGQPAYAGHGEARGNVSLRSSLPGPGARHERIETFVMHSFPDPEAVAAVRVEAPDAESAVAFPAGPAKRLRAFGGLSPAGDVAPMAKPTGPGR